MAGVDIIGDIHGHADALERLLDAWATSYETAFIIIPRTPSSSSVTSLIVARDSALCSALLAR